MQVPEALQSLADDLGLPVETLLKRLAMSEDLMMRLEHALRPFDLMGKGKRIRPEETLTEAAAKVWCGKGVLYAKLPEYSNAFRDAMHHQNMMWDKAKKRWARELQPWNGSLKDRLVELCCEILAAGFICALPSEGLEDDVLEGRYEKEHTRWVLRRTEIGNRSDGDYKDYFALKWSRDHEKGDDLYDKARALPGSRWSKPSVVVPARSYEAVRDFAEMYGFRLSEGAERLAEAAEQKAMQDLIGAAERPAKKTGEEAAEEDLDPAGVSTEIDEALRDDV